MTRDRNSIPGSLLLEKVLLFCGTLTFLWSISTLVGVHALRSKKTTPAPITSVPVKFHENHRPIQWCVNGVDEPEFQKYPWSEFRPILQRKYYDHFLANVRFKYTIGLWPIMINSSTKDIGSGGNLYQRAHFTFKSELRKAFEEGVRLNFNNTAIEGLLVQANFAPYGVGLPFGQFIHPKEFNCVDCKAPIGIPIACRRRTYMHVVHPTLFAFHYNMKIPPQEANRRREGCFNKVVPMQCIITGFKETDSNASAYMSIWEWENLYKQYEHQPPPGMSSTCQYDDECDDLFKSWFSSDCCLQKSGGMCINNGTGTGGAGAPMVKQFCPNVGTDPAEEVSEDPYVQSKDWPIFECKPYEVTVCRKFGEPRIPAYDTLDDLQIDHATGQPYPPGSGAPPGFDPFSKAEQCCLGAAAGAASCPTLPPGAPPEGAKVCPDGFDCVARVVPPIDREATPWVEVFPGQADGDKCGDILKEDYFGRTDIVHGNFVWYLAPCQGTTVRARFLMMVVHSFQKGIYSIVESEDYYELKSGAGSGSTKLNPHIPSPLFTGFPHTCEVPSTAQYLYSTTNQNEGFDYSRSYDECVQNATGKRYVNDQVCEGVPSFVPDSGRKKKGRPEPAQPSTSLVPKCDGNAGKKPITCEYRCPGLPSTTPEYIYMEQPSVIKRTLHGGINIVTNFCIMPICVFIARFYKETFNLQGYKGQKTWYWMHMIGAGGSTILQYMGYFTGKLVDDSDAHLVYGNIYIICLGLSYITSWMRHKNRWISMIVESTHSITGYCCFLLALVCVTNAKKNNEPISSAVKYVVYVAIASLTVFYVGMTVHICSLDKKFGMKPKRWHFPSVEARFDDLPVPGRNVRKVFLFVVLFINLPLTLSTLFL